MNPPMKHKTTLPQRVLAPMLLFPKAVHLPTFRLVAVKQIAVFEQVPQHHPFATCSLIAVAEPHPTDTTHMCLVALYFNRRSGDK